MATYALHNTAMIPDLSTVTSTLATCLTSLVRDDVAARTYESIDFGVVDPKGRCLGARACRFSSTLQVWHDAATGEPVPRSNNGVYPEGSYEPRPGTVWCFIPQALRAGKPYGASQATNMYDTEAEREAAIALYWTKGRKRAVKIAKTGRA